MILSISGKIGYPALAGIVGGQSIGLPLPGGTALITAGALAAHGKLNIVAICIVGVMATIVGSNIGFGIGRRYGVEFLKAPGPLAKKRHHFLKAGRPIVEKYGWLAVLFARSIPVVRESAPIVAGSLEMKWHKFILWNAIGGVAWVFEHSLLGYFFGDSIEHSVTLIGIIGLKLLLISLIGAGIAYHVRHKDGESEDYN